MVLTNEGKIYTGTFDKSVWIPTCVEKTLPCL